MKIFTVPQIRNADVYTIEHEPISSEGLMERASETFVHWFSELYTSEYPVWIFAGIGNNGGDGLCAARMLAHKGYKVNVFIIYFSDKTTADFDLNLKRLSIVENVSTQYIHHSSDLPAEIPPKTIIIDAILGAGLGRRVEDGFLANILDFMNQSGEEIVAIDIPSGVFADIPTIGHHIRATRTFSFEFPKIAFMFPENSDRVGDWVARGIGLHPKYIENEYTPYFYIDSEEVKNRFRPRKKFAHKGNFGHAFLVVGSKGKMGAGILAARACMRSGVGLLTVRVPRSENIILQIAVPEAMVETTKQEVFIKNDMPNIEKYQVIGIGCGIGTQEQTQLFLHYLLLNYRKPMVLDADALNIIAQNPDWLNLLPSNSILSPHLKEFERLFGTAKNDFHRNDIQRQKAIQYGVILILKGAHTAVALPSGEVYFNSTGNAGMATAGSGDVLTGILTGLLAQGYTPTEAAILGVYHHGKAGDEAAAKKGEYALIASDLIENLRIG